MKLFKHIEPGVILLAQTKIQPNEEIGSKLLDKLELARKNNRLTGPEGQQVIEIAGRECYDSFSGKGRFSDDYAKHILEVGHGSVLEHVNFTFYLYNISRNLTHELIRHRVGTAISQRSTRYVDEDNSDFIYHPLLQKYLDSLDQSLEAEDTLDLLNEISQFEISSRNLYRSLCDRLQEFSQGTLGYNKFDARKQARGAARGFLPTHLSTSLVWTCNMRELRHIFTLRGHPTADAEIRLLANKLFDIIEKELPIYVSDMHKEDNGDGIGYNIISNNIVVSKEDWESQQLELQGLRDEVQQYKQIMNIGDDDDIKNKPREYDNL